MASCGAIVCSVVIDPGVTPRTSQRRSSPLPTSTVTMRCEVESGSIAMLFITPAPPAPPSGVRLRNHSVTGIAATIAQNQSNELKPLDMTRPRPAGRRAAPRPAAPPRGAANEESVGASSSAQPAHALARRHDVGQADAELLVDDDDLAL